MGKGTPLVGPIRVEIGDDKSLANTRSIFSGASINAICWINWGPRMSQGYHQFVSGRDDVVMKQPDSTIDCWINTPKDSYGASTFLMLNPSIVDGPSPP